MRRFEPQRCHSNSREAFHAEPFLRTSRRCQDSSAESLAGVGLDPSPTTDSSVFAQHRPQAHWLGRRTALPKRLDRLADAEFELPKAVSSGAKPTIGASRGPPAAAQVFAENGVHRYELKPRPRGPKTVEPSGARCRLQPPASKCAESKAMVVIHAFAERGVPIRWSGRCATRLRELGRIKGCGGSSKRRPRKA